MIRMRKKFDFFLGEFKDVPDPVIDPNSPLKIPDQQDIEALFVFMRKYIDALEQGVPNSDAIKAKLQMNSEGKIDLNKLLSWFRFKPIFKEISFSIEGDTYNRAKGVPGIKPVRYTSMFNNLILQDALFDSVKIEDLNLSGSKLSNVTITNSSFSRTVCLNCQFLNVNFEISSSKDADFSFSSGNVTFNKDDISYLKITDSNFDAINFKGGTLKNSVFINTKNVNLDGTDTYSIVDDSATAESLPLKTVGLVFDDTFPGGTGYKILNKIRASNYQDIKIEYGLEGYIDGESLQKEVETIIDKVSSMDNGLSIPQNMVDQFRQEKVNYPQMAKIASMAHRYINKMDALIIPGGLDIEPYFYNNKISAKNFYKDIKYRLHGLRNVTAEDYPTRSILEIFLINFSQEKNLPLFLICRGAHIYNIYKNGKMIENLPDLYDTVAFDEHLRFITEAPNLSPEDKDQTIIKLFEQAGGESVKVYGNHHQAIDKKELGVGLRILLVWKLPGKTSIPYALYDPTYAPGAWLTQFHPEVKEKFGGAMARQLSDFNSELFTSFFALMDQTTSEAVQENNQETAEEPAQQPEEPPAHQAEEPAHQIKEIPSAKRVIEMGEFQALPIYYSPPCSFGCGAFLP